MPTLDELPVELLAHVALFTNKVDNRYDIDVRELLALRCASRCCRDAVRRAARQHEAVYCLGFRGSSAQSIAAIGRVFGVGCRDLFFLGVKSDECVSALRDLVMSTNGQLRKLSSLGGTPNHPEIVMLPKPVLLEMCRACPLLEYLYLDNVPDSIPANVDDFASALGSACPLLNSVSFPIPGGRSPAEDYQWYFPRSVCLRFSRAANTHLPIRWDKIELTLRTCVHATEVGLMDDTVSPRLVDLILAAPVAGRLKTLDVSCETDISPESILRFARGLEMLTDLRLPNHFNGESAFYRSLVQARPAIVRLGLGFDGMLDDEDLRIICHGLRLEFLELPWADNLTDRAIDIVLESPCAQTLRSVDVSYAPQFSSEDVLRLVRGCPRLADLEWETSEEHPLDHDADGPNVDAIDAILTSRGGRTSGVRAYGPEYW